MALDLEGKHIFPPLTKKQMISLANETHTALCLLQSKFTYESSHLTYQAFFPPLFYYGETSVSEEDVPSSPHAISHSPAVGVAASLPRWCLFSLVTEHLTSV